MDKTIVIFRTWKSGSVIALFPEDPSDTRSDYYCNSYMHIGQHGSADPHVVIWTTQRALPEDYKELAQELKGLGYDLIVRQRYTRQMQTKREKEWQRMMSKEYPIES